MHAECSKADDSQPSTPLQKVSLSRTTFAGQIEEIGENVSEQLRSKLDVFQYFLLTFNESADVIDSAQLPIFIRALAKNLSINLWC